MARPLKSQLQLFLGGILILVLGYMVFHAWIWSSGPQTGEYWGRDMGCRFFGSLLMLLGAGMVVSSFFPRSDSPA